MKTNLFLSLVLLLIGCGGDMSVTNSNQQAQNTGQTDCVDIPDIDNGQILIVCDGEIVAINEIPTDTDEQLGDNENDNNNEAAN